MTMARDIMQPAEAIVHVAHSLREALIRFRESDTDYLVALDGNQVAGVIDRALLVDLDAKTPGISDELIGNLDSLKFRTCRLDDDITVVERLLTFSDAGIVAVVDEDHQIHGLIGPSDLAPGDDTAAPDRKRRARDPMEKAPDTAPFGEVKSYTTRPHVPPAKKRRD
ncbi:CBS domain-containing protein [Oceanibacterium hippocampi]|uniref:CBS domain protein n=1 Tax=Oceanibacterium hippocampi TaxID=745714 RepID=A0A1Y5TKG9_9PROT|nr:CBS domain-containing protein [Oceanibacterium hippocampi]SLN62512.1 CBS domain protein [Oceanibacterium hippocampi]